MDAGFVPSIKCVLIGDYEVGKTSLINAFATREPLNQYFPGLTGPVQIHIEHAFRLYLLHVHDTEGAHAPTPKTTPVLSPQLNDPGLPPIDLSETSINAEDVSNESNQSSSAKWISRRMEYGLADVVLICFSLANRASFENVATVFNISYIQWREEIQQFCPHVPFIVVGCKLDLRRPDPTTPASIPKRLHPPSAMLQLRRPKPARSSTGGSTNNSTGPGSLSTSDVGHPMSDSSMTRPVSILTNSLTSATKGNHETPAGPSSPPSSDAENFGKKLRPRSSFPVPFPVKVFRRKSVNDASISSPQKQPSFPQPDNRRVEAKASPNSDEQPASPKSPRYSTLPPFMRSISHANVFRKVVSRSRSGTVAADSPSDAMSNPSDSTVPSPDGMPDPSRPALPHRLTSGSVDNSNVRKLHSHVRTSSQPSPTSVSSQPETTGTIGNESTGVGGDVELPGGSLAVGSAGAGSATSSNPRPSPGKKVTRIEEPPLAMRHRTMTYQEARGTARLLGASGYMECSSLTLVNVVKVFDEAVRIAVERRLASASSLHGRRGKKNEECVVM